MTAELTSWHRQQAASISSIGEQLPMRAFKVVIGPRSAPLAEFEAMATDSETCFQQHIDLAGHERLTVKPVHFSSRSGEPSTGVA